MGLVILNSIKRKVNRMRRNFAIKAVSCGQFKTKKTLPLPSPLKIEGGYVFSSLYLSNKGYNLVGADDSGKYFIKIELKKCERKTNDLVAETEIIRKLNEKNAVSCPKLFDNGTLDSVGADLIKRLFPEEAATSYPYLIMENIQSDSSVRLSDILFTVLEQKSLGFYHGDIKPENIRFSYSDGVCYLVDYDQTVELTSEQQKKSIPGFLDWMDQHQKETYHEEADWLRHFPTGGRADVAYLLVDGALDLSSTTLYINQQTTNTENGVYHSIYTDDLYAKGVRDISDREKILSQMEFRSGEKVVDIGCNIGLLTHYLAGRGCEAWGFELDPSIAKAANMIAHIMNIPARFEAFDLDEKNFSQVYDTIMLFSVFHHTKDLVANGKKVADHFNRIIIECRLVESGRKPTYKGESWEQTSNWNFDSLDGLTRHLEELFPGFKFVKDHGQADKGRYILELRKELH